MALRIGLLKSAIVLNNSTLNSLIKNFSVMVFLPMAYYCIISLVEIDAIRYRKLKDSNKTDFMSWLTVNKSLRSYKFPIIKIIVAVITVAALGIASWNLDVENEMLTYSVRFVGLVLMFTSFVCIGIAFLEIEEINKRKRKSSRKKKAKPQGKLYRINQLIELLDKNDIIEIVIQLNDTDIKIGTSSDMTRSGKFFDKKYFIDECEYITLDEFKIAFSKICSQNEVLVRYIDDVKV